MVGINDFHKINGTRCITDYPNTANWTQLEWAAALCGEAGELANSIKKMKIIEQRLSGLGIEVSSIRFSEMGAVTFSDMDEARMIREMRHLEAKNLAVDWYRHASNANKEIADVMAYLSLVAWSLGVADLEAVVREKFNEVSEKKGSEYRV